MAAEQKMTKEEERLQAKDIFRRNALLVIEEMVELSPVHPSKLVDEILHSIFFLGEIHNPPLSPEEIFIDDEVLNELQDLYPRSFQLYSSQLPRRDPMSHVLDMIVDLEGRENEDEIIERLQELIRQLELPKTRKHPLTPSTICVSQNKANPNSVRYYGLSMSTTGKNPGKIMVGASCLAPGAWDSYIAGAVMTYYPEEKKKKEKKSYFDGTIKLPEQVRCEAFNISRGKKMDPCRSCGNLFGLTTRETNEWAYGSCAEAESLSNLFKTETDVKEQAQPTAETYTDANRARAAEDVRIQLNGFLKNVQFSWDQTFYTPETM